MSFPKKILIAAGGVAILAAGIGVGVLLGDGKAAPAREPTVAIGGVGQSAAVGSAKTDAPVSEQHSYIPRNVGVLENGVAADMDDLVRVVRAVDGDTIEVELGGGVERVRYIGIDTPETVDPRKPVQCFGVEASKKNKELVAGKMVRLEKDIIDRDKYNRLLRYVWLDDTLVNLELVAQGFATSYSYPPDIKYQERFMAAEKKAREDKLGLWTACASVSKPVTQATPTAQAATANPSCTIKGNISAAGEKIYHLQGCGLYAKTAIDETRGERWFCSEQEARTSGWRRALNCP